MRIGPSLSIAGVNSVTPEAIIRSLGPAAWYRPGVGVTGTLTASNWADQSGNGRDLAQGTAGNQPIYLPYSGTAYGWMSGAASNDFSSPDKAAPLGDMAIAIRLAADDFTPSLDQYLFTKHNDPASQNGIQFYLASSGMPVLQWSTDGNDVVGSASSVAPTTTNGSATWLLATLDVDDGGVWKSRYYQSDEAVNDPEDVVSWTLLSTVTGGGTTSQGNNTATFSVGGYAGGATVRFAGKIYRAVLYSDLTLTTKVVDFSPSTFAETSTNGATAVASTGETWTLNSTGAYPATIVKSPQLLFGGVDEYMKTAGFTLNQPTTVYFVGKALAWTDAKSFFDGESSSSMRFFQNDGGGYVGGTPNVQVYAGSYLAGTQTNMDAWELNTNAIITCVFNGASSSFSVNATEKKTGDAGSSNAGGFTLCARGDAAAPGNAIVKEVIIFSAAHTAAQRALMQQALNSMHRCY